MHVAIAVLTIIASFKWANWKNWREYHASMFLISSHIFKSYPIYWLFYLDYFMGGNFGIV